MKKIPFPLPTVVALVCAAVVLLFTLPGQAQPQPLATRHVRDAVANGQAQLIGKLPSTQTLRFDMVLPLRDRAGLQDFVQEVQDPRSPSYHQFLTPQEFTARFGPSQQDWDALVAFAKASGFGEGLPCDPGALSGPH
jgi:kumamolisin